MPQSTVFDFCRGGSSDMSVGRRKHLLAASMKPWYNSNVKSGSGSSRKNSFSTPVISLMSARFSSERKSTESMSDERKQSD